jgi:hypothetical protein
LKALRTLRTPSSQSGSTTAVANLTTQNQLTVHIELQQVKQADDGAFVDREPAKGKFNDSYFPVEMDGKDAYSDSADLRPVPIVTSAESDIERQQTAASQETESDGARNFQRQI